MKHLAPLLVLAVFASPAARAADVGDVGIGVGVALSSDLPDPASKGGARFHPGPSLQIPFRYQLAPLARLRLDGRIDLETGHDQVRWQEEIDGQTVDLQSQGHWTMLLAAGLSAGADFTLPVKGPVAPYLGADLGIAWVGTYHSFSGPTEVLLDPTQNHLDNPHNVDPYTSQATFLTDVHGGVDVPVSDGLALWAETGYSVAFLNARELKKTPPALNATRDAYGWNAIRIGAGVLFVF
jgi:hypothetical protein